MKIIVFLFCLFSSTLLSSTGIYDLEFQSLNGDTIRMSDFSGKKLIVNIVRSSNPEPERLTALKDIYLNSSATVDVLLIPITDFDSSTEYSNLLTLLRDSLQLPFKITALSKGMHSQESTQHPLIQWLNDKSQNQHFDGEIQDESRMFVISESGVLFADLKGAIDLNGAFFTKILLRPDESTEAQPEQPSN